jgi:multidrug resistance efflux pump
MDIARPPQKKTARNLAIGAGILAVIVVTILLGRLGPAVPTIDDATLYKDSVQKGDMVREVRGPGNLVPEHIRFITAVASGRVERLVAQSGQQVQTGAALLEMSNPDVQVQTLQAEQALSSAEVALLNLRTSLNTQRLAQEGVVATTRTQFIAASQDAATADSLLKRKLISAFDYNSKHATADELTTRVKLERQKLDLVTQTIDSQLAVQGRQVTLLRTIADFQRNVLASLLVKSPDNGVLQDLTLQLGQWVPAGTTVAKVVQPGSLKAVLHIPETQAKDVQIGQAASIDTRNGIVPGHVARKDPSASNGSVTVDVALDGPLPAGAVPDLSIDGTIQIERLKNVLSVGRPAYGAPSGLVGLYKIIDGGAGAVRVQVQLGRSSVNTVEVVRGLNVGDRIILSDMSQWDAAERVKLKR